MRVFLLGLDGATFDLIDPWIKEAKLPNFARIVEEGVKGELISVTPPTSPGAWTSIATGKNPGKHGLFDWRVRRENSYDLIPVSAANRHGQTLWDILSENNLKVGLLNVPMTYPPEMINGFMVSGLDTPSEQEVFTYPPDLYHELLANCGGYVIDTRYKARGGREEWLAEIEAMVRAREGALRYLMKKYPCDFLMAVFLFPDRLQHRLWHCVDPSHPAYSPAMAEKYGGVLLEFYQMADRLLGELFEQMDENTTLFIVSDHGFGPVHKLIFVNKFLENLGLLEIKRDASPPKIDWPHTRAYAFGYHGSIYLNLRGREPEGVVRPGQEYEELREQIIEALKSFVDPETGKPIVGTIYKREQVYFGPYVNRAPDVLFQPAEDTPYRVFDGFNYIGAPDLPLIVANPAPGTGGHRLNGIFLAWGKHIRPGQALTEASVVDVAPTILYLMGQPIPDDMDGRVLKEMFGPELLARPVEYVPAPALEEELAESVYSDEDIAKISERLRSLGYI